ncbi:unnamed protein product [Litomosoides sigmodontis]|uniref:Anaphase-promoting complex subunit 4-like WD40 domain-containing protein n=1 Tax=Litomosoides sigmodontis TaxID=42156 RepID=A0A3P6UTL5_LITSI|nr:unnamed protein product [Litomosoides sigmodontis]
MDSICMSNHYVSSDLMGKTVLTRRSPFKVHQALWNPSIDLLTLASQKGEVCVRRLHWRHGWKRDIYDVKPLLLDLVKSEGEIRLETMCWSPDGKILATAFSDGCIHLLDAEKGIVRFTVRMKTRVTRMRWQRFNQEFNMNLINEDALSGALGDLSENESLNDKSEELNQLRAMKAFCDSSNLSVLGTLLFALNVDNSVIILAAGVLPIASVEPPFHLFGNCDPYSITVGDMFYSSKRDQLIVVYSSRGQLNPASSSGMNTQVISFDIDSLGYLKNGLIWTIARRWLKLVFCVCFISEAFARAIVDWEDQSKEFIEKFSSFGEENTSNCCLGEYFINMILTGQTSPELVSFYRNVLKPTEWKKMTDWTNKGFGDIIESIGRELLPGAEALQHNMKQLFIEARCALYSCRTEKLLPKRLFDVDVYPYGKYAEENEESSLQELKSFQNLAEDIINKINEMHLVATRNRKDLVSFTSWLSQTPPFTARNKRPAAKMKFDLQLIIEYIKQTTIAKNGNAPEGNESMVNTFQNYSFDKVLQYFHRQKPLKYHLDVRSNSWNLLSEQRSSRTLADSITSCFDVLQIIQDIFLKNFTAAVTAKANLVLEQSHAEGFEKFAIFLPNENASTTCTYDEQRWLSTIVDEPFSVSCIGVNGSRHIIYGASSKVLYEISYSKGYIKNVASFGKDVKAILSENSESRSFQVKIDGIKLSSDEQQLQKIGKSTKGVDNVMDASGCSESYVSFAVSFHRKSGVVFTENGFRAKWFDIQIPLQTDLIVNRNQSISGIHESNQMKNLITEAMDVTEQLHVEEGLVVEQREEEGMRESVQLRRSVRKRKPLKK